MPVTDRDEGLFAATTKEMISSGDYLNPRFKARDAFTKPIGVYWAQAAAVLSIGRDRRNAIWPYRVPSLIAMLLTVAITWQLGRLMFDNSVALLSAGILGTCPLAVVEAHIATTDAMLLAACTLVMLCLWLIYRTVNTNEKPTRIVVAGFWLALGLGVLLKGPVVPAAATLTVCALVILDPLAARRTKLLRALHPA